MLRLGASLWGFFHEQPAESWPSLAEAVRTVSSLDRRLGVEVWGCRSMDEPEVEGPARVDLASACADAAFVSVHVQGQHWAWDPRALRGEIDLAHQLGAGTLVLHPICLGLAAPDDRPDWPEIVRIADDAAKFGVRLAVENIFDSIWSLDRILEEIGDDPDETNLGICIDVGHAALSKDAGRDAVCSYLDRYAGQLVHLHLHDNHGLRDDHLVPGEGIIDWRRVLERLHELDYDGTAMLEVRQPGGRMEDALTHSIEILQQATSANDRRM